MNDDFDTRRIEATQPRETPKERVDRELIELLNELRVALPGVQVLFAFLLTVPFSSRFEALSDPHRSVYFVTFLATLGASALLMAPTAYHRIRFREGDKEQMLRSANRFALAGLGLLVIAITSASYLVADMMYGGSLALLVAASVLVALVSSWFGLPLVRKARDGG
jgi:hypothetical protein